MDFRVSVAAHDLRRKDRAALARQGQPAARHDEARLRAEAARRLQGAINQPYGHGAGHGPDRFRQDDDAVFGAVASSTRPSTNIITAEDPVEYNLHGINQVQMHDDIGLTFADGPARVPAPGPGHHHGRRDPRLRDGGDRGQGGAHGPPGALHACTPTTRRHDLAPAQHGRGALLDHGQREPGAGAAPRARKICVDCKTPFVPDPARCATSVSPTNRWSRRKTNKLSTAQVARPATAVRLQGPRRPVRSHALHRPLKEMVLAGRVHGRAEDGGDPRRHVLVAYERHQQDPRGRHDHEEVLRVTMAD